MLTLRVLSNLCQESELQGDDLLSSMYQLRNGGESMRQQLQQQQIVDNQQRKQQLLSAPSQGNGEGNGEGGGEVLVGEGEVDQMGNRYILHGWWGLF